MPERLRVGDRVRIKDDISLAYDAYDYRGEYVEVREVEDEYYNGTLTYFVRAADGHEFWPYDDNLDFGSAATSAVTLTLEKAVEVREALEALGWNRDDLGPLAHAEKPKRVIKATLTFPADADAQLRYARADITTAVEGWNGTITFDSDN